MMSEENLAEDQFPEVNSSIKKMEDILAFVLKIISQLSFIDREQIQVAEKILKGSSISQQKSKIKTEGEGNYHKLISEMHEENCRLKEQIIELRSQRS